MSGVAIVLAVIAAFGDEKGFAAATAIIVGVSIFFLSPLMWIALSHNKDNTIIVGIFLAAIVAPFVVIVVRSANFNTSAKPAPPTPDYRSQTDAWASGPRSESSQQWEVPQETPFQKKMEPAQSAGGPSSKFEVLRSFAERTAAGFTKGAPSTSQVMQTARGFLPPPQVALFALLAIAAVAFIHPPSARLWNDCERLCIDDRQALRERNTGGLRSLWDAAV